MNALQRTTRLLNIDPVAHKEIVGYTETRCLHGEVRTYMDAPFCQEHI